MLERRSMRLSTVTNLALLLAALAFACSSASSSDEAAPAGADAGPESGAGGSASGSDDGGPLALAAAFDARGFTVGAGSFEFLDMAGCCATNCSGNNPSSPYAAIHVPPAPGQTAPNETARGDGLASSFRLRQDEAVVLLATKPPPARYFGFTPYLMTRDSGDGGARRSVFASLSETANNETLGLDGERLAIIVAGDVGTVDAAKGSLVASGYPDSAINVLGVDPSVFRFGLDVGADTAGVLFRMALVDDPARKAAYVADPKGVVYRLTPKTAAATKPMPAAAARPKGTSTNEDALRPAVNKLGLAIAAAHPGFTATPVAVTEGTPDPSACIAGARTCAGDNRDTNYPGTAPRVLFESDDDFYVVYGVNHDRTSKTTYANVSVYAVEHLVGITSVASDQYPGSAADYIPDDPAESSLYAWRIARSCTGVAHCLEVKKGACPSGIDDGALGTITFRTYLEPGTATAPDPDTLVRDRVIHFKKN